MEGLEIDHSYVALSPVPLSVVVSFLAPEFRGFDRGNNLQVSRNTASSAVNTRRKFLKALTNRITGFVGVAQNPFN